MEIKETCGWFTIEKKKDGTKLIHMPLFGDFVTVDASQDASEAWIKKMVKMRLYHWVMENFTRCLPYDEWADLTEEEVKQQLCIGRCIREVMGIGIEIEDESTGTDKTETKEV